MPSPQSSSKDPGPVGGDGLETCVDCETVRLHTGGLDYPGHECPYPVHLWQTFVAMDDSDSDPLISLGDAQQVSPPPSPFIPNETTAPSPLYDEPNVTQAANPGSLVVQNVLRGSPSDGVSGTTGFLRVTRNEKPGTRPQRHQSEGNAGRIATGYQKKIYSSPTTLKFSHVEMRIRKGWFLLLNALSPEPTHYAAGSGTSEESKNPHPMRTPREIRAQRRELLKSKNAA
ncbi:hypothetical protein FB446DRAFT_794003 [Lentinula raphanica]|nr:hypothetical protein FB446DRAFT_794003 [Lentinula raphanica]